MVLVVLEVALERGGGDDCIYSLIVMVFDGFNIKSFLLCQAMFLFIYHDQTDTD